MPPVLGAATVIGTLPHSLSTKFTEAHSVPMNMNQYRDLTSQRVALVTGGRKSWKISKRLDPSSVSLLRQFCYAAKGGAFYFYNPSETNPPYSNNPSGTAGRYLVRFNSDWSQTTGMSRSETSIELVEVSEVGAVDIGAPIVPDGSPSGGDDGGGGIPPSPTLAQIPINPSIEGGEWLSLSSHGYNVGYGPINYGGYLWTYGAASEFDNSGSLTVTGAGMYKSADGGLTWSKQGGDVWLGEFPNATYWDGTSSTITFVIGGFHGPRSLGANPASLVDFDMATGLYGTQTPLVQLQPAADPVSGDESAYGVRLFKLSNGTFRVVYQSVQENAEMCFVDYAGGEWGSQTLIAGADGNAYGSVPPSVTPFSGVQDGDTINIVAAVSSGGSLVGYQYWRIALDGTVSSPSVVSALDVSDIRAWTINSGIISGDSIIIPTARENFYSTAPFSDTDMGVLVGTPKASPTFTWVPVGAGHLGTIPSDSQPHDMKITRLGSTAYFGWLQMNPDSGWMSQIYLATSADNGASWSTPRLLLDVEATPPPNTDDDGNYTGLITVDGNSPFTRKIHNFSFGTGFTSPLGLMYTSWATYWTNAPALLP